MAFLLRRALRPSKTLLSLRTPRHLSSLTRPSPLFSNRSPREPPLLELRGAALGFYDHLGSDFSSFVSRRGFAKGKKSSKSNREGEGDGDDDTIQVDSNIGLTVKSTALSQMEAATVALSRELMKLRTGRASAGMLDHIIVETNGMKSPLSHVALVSVLDAKTLSVTPHDSNALKALESAIVSSPLGLNPKVDGQRLIAVIPLLTKENMQAVCKIVSKSAEDVKQSIRRARQKALDSIKKAKSSIPKDDVKRLGNEIEEMTKRFVKEADDMCKTKEKEITGS